jgi:hypothetical protein
MPSNSRKDEVVETNLPHVTRRGIVAIARDELGLPFSKGRLDKLSMLGKGPKAIGEFGGRHLYEKEEVVRWLRSLIKPVAEKAPE